MASPARRAEGPARGWEVHRRRVRAGTCRRWCRCRRRRARLRRSATL